MMALGDDLSADQQINLVALNSADKGRNRAGARHIVAGHDGDPKVGKPVVDFFSKPLNPGPASNQTVPLTAFRTLGRKGQRITAVMALAATPPPMLD